MKSIRNIFLVFMCFASISAYAHINPDVGAPAPTPTITEEDNPEVSFREDCQPATSQIDMNINNVRARLLTGGDIWWDLNEGKYVVPNPPIGSGIPEVSSIFAGGVWIGGQDPAGNLKIAATTYRSGGNTDFYAGPLNPETGLTDLEICNNWDEFFVVEGTELSAAINIYDQALITGDVINCDSLPDGVKFWPGKDNPFFEEKYPFSLPSGQNLGSFWDEDLSGDYNPCKGDFPIIDIRGCEPSTRKEAVELVPDQMIFWIYNDAGGEHRLTRGQKIQMEVQVQAFAYATNDAINDMTFQRYKLLNRAEEDIRECYFAMWVDPDLGCHTDDFVGCDVERSLAYTYNEDILDGTTGCNCDGGVNTYCDRVPIIGTDYFRGPIGPFKIVDCAIGEEHVVAVADDFEGTGLEVGDTICVQRIDIEESDDADIGIELGMSSFIYYNNGGVGTPDPNTVDPSSAQQYYNYLQGLWLNGTPMTFGGTGLDLTSVDETRYAFPDDPNDPDGWSMCTVTLGNGDRRTLQASGPMLLKPSVENELIVGAVWVPDLEYPCPDISKLKRADDLAQALFDNCFNILDGPTAPDVCPIALDREIILVLSNDSIASNNAFESYIEKDIFAIEEIPEEDAQYQFEGYRIYQLANAAVSPQELGNQDVAREIFTVDKSNGVGEIYNWTSQVDPTPGSGALVYSPQRMVDGLDQGIKHTFRVTEDAFAPGDNRLLNHTEYHFMVLAYGYNNFETFDPTQPQIGQPTPYIEGRKNVKTYTVVPRPIVYDQQNAQYGDGAIITRVDGVGVGGNFLDMDESMYEIILNESFDGKITYKEGAGPITVNIYDPINVQDGTFSLKLIGDHAGGDECRLQDGAMWELKDLESGEVIESESTIDFLNEQLVTNYGFSVGIRQAAEPGDNGENNNGAIDIVSEYADPSGAAWYGALLDGAQGLDVGPGLIPFFNFIRTESGEPDNLYDNESAFSRLGERTFYPFFLTYGADDENIPFYLTPAWQPQQGFVRTFSSMNKLNNVDLVFTSDKSKWSRCAVVETAGPGFATVGETTQGNAGNLDLREADSVDKNGDPDGSGIGMSWFPGYAIDVETGMRLNVFFGENSVFDEDMVEYLDLNDPIGGDMMYNPSSQIFSDFPTAAGFDPRLLPVGGKHVIYVTREEYDGCEKFVEQVQGNTLSKVNAYTSVTWCSMTLLPEGQSMLSYADGAIPNEYIVKLRADNGYGQEQVFDITSPTGCNTVGGNPTYEFEIRGKEAVAIDASNIDDALSNVNVVPNPYYAYSAYEISNSSKTVKITNLPALANVTIFSLDGKFIRQFKRDERAVMKSGSNPGVINTQEVPDLLWDLNNTAGIPVASGVYLIHIKDLEFGAERTIKWFGINRQFDASGL